MIKEKLKKIILTVCFLGCFFAVFYFVDSILKFKYDDGVKPIANFYDLPEDTVDVLLLGTSHMGMNVDPSILWEEQGIAAYSCWGGMQPTWNTYFFLKECLKYQTPKLVVMDTHLATNDIEYDTYENTVKNIVGMRMSKNKIDAINVSARPEYKYSVLLGIPTYHYRYASLTAEDFQNFFWNRHTEIQSNTYIGDRIQPIHIPDYTHITETAELSEKLGTYLLKIIDLCEEQNIPLLLVSSPYELHEIEQKRYNKIAEIAEEHQITFLNFNNFYQEIGIDTERDYLDPGHFNYGGIKKYSSYLAYYIKSHYELPDRRLDPNHIWNTAAKEEDPCVYRLEQQFIGGGLNYLDTGEKLYAIPFASYTLLARIDTNCTSNDKVWLSCFSEETGNLRGILVRREKDTIYVIFDEITKTEITDFGDTIDLAVVKNGVRYEIYVDGEKVGEQRMNNSNAYDGTLLLGCQVNENGKRFRYSETTVENLELYNTALTGEQIRDWNPDPIPLPQSYQAPAAGSSADFELTEQFIGDGVEKYLDTGMPLYADPEDSWTVLAKFSEDPGNGAGVYFSCFNEEAEGYRGLMVRHLDPGSINVLYGIRSEIFTVPENSEITVAISKEKYQYNVYINGERVVEDMSIEADSYGGNLLIGCQETPSGEKMRFSGVTVYNLEVYKGSMSPERILEWNPERKPIPEQKQASPVSYKLPQPFIGDGSKQFIDTGVQLYDTIDKSWTLEMRFRKTPEGGQMLASCFAEDPKNYRGLMITQLDDNTLNLTLGKISIEAPLPPQPENDLKIVKEGYEYSVFVNGEPVAEHVVCQTSTYDGTLHLGCAVDVNGNPFRFSKAKILQFTVTDHETAQ